MPRKPRRNDKVTPDSLATALVKAQRDADRHNDPDARERARQGRLLYRLRRQALPHYVLAAIAVTALIARAAVHYTGNPTAVATTVATVLAVAMLIAGLMLRTRISTPWRERAAVLALAVAVWLVVVPVVGFSWNAVGLLMLAGYAAALPWWRRHRIPNPTSKPIAAAMAEESVPQLWRTNIGAKDGTLAGSYLTDETHTRSGVAYAMQLRPGKHSIGSALAALPLIASGLRCDPADLVIDRHPTGDASRGMIQVITRSPIKQTITFPGPQYDPATGTIRMGLFADGESDPLWRLYTENSMWGGVIIGGPGSGKSRLTEELAISAQDSGCTTIFYGDPQEGASSPALAEHANYVARGVPAIVKMLRGLERITKWRAKENAVAGLEGFTPSPERPGILVILDECHRVFANEEARILAEWIAREGRKVGVAIICASQYPGLITFGNSEALRSAIMIGNAVVLRTASKTTKGIMAGLEFDPAFLPAIPGYAYLVDTTGNGRTAPFRSYYVSDPAAWLADTRQVELDQLSANAFGPEYTERHALATAAADALRAELEAMKAGPLTRAQTEHEPAPAGRTEKVSVDQVDAERVGDVVEFPAVPKALAAGATEGQVAILQAIRDGHDTPSALRTETGWGETYVRRLLSELVDAGRITKAGHGRYAIASDSSKEAS